MNTRKTRSASKRKTTEKFAEFEQSKNKDVKTTLPVKQNTESSEKHTLNFKKEKSITPADKPDDNMNHKLEKSGCLDMPT